MPCPASTKLMRTSTSGQTVTEVGTTSVIVMPYSPTRVTAIIGYVGAVSPTLSYRTPLPSLQGISLVAGAPRLILTLGDHGELVKGPIYAIQASGTSIVTVWDSHLPERFD